VESRFESDVGAGGGADLAGLDVVEGAGFDLAAFLGGGELHWCVVSWVLGVWRACDALFAVFLLLFLVYIACAFLTRLPRAIAPALRPFLSCRAVVVVPGRAGRRLTRRPAGSGHADC
jgi:hypothetical protein